MTTGHATETSHDRALLASQAGKGRISWLSDLAGVLTAYGTAAVLLGLAAAALSAVGSQIDLGAGWQELGLAGGIAAALALFLAYLFGGYVAGRMARRAGLLNGLVTFVLAVLLAVAVSALAGGFAANADVDATPALRSLQGFGIPTSADQWAGAGTVAGLVALAAMLGGALLGGTLGERWHTRLTRRAERGRAAGQESARREAEAAERARREEAERQEAAREEAVRQARREEAERQRAMHEADERRRAAATREETDSTGAVSTADVRDERGRRA